MKSSRSWNSRFDDLFAAELERRLPGTDPEEFMPYNLRDETPEERKVLHHIYDRMNIWAKLIWAHSQS